MNAPQISLPSVLRGRELRLERAGVGYSISIVGITGGDTIATVACQQLSLSATYSDDRVRYALTAAGTQPGSSVAHIHISSHETEQLADWLGLPVPCVEGTTP